MLAYHGSNVEVVEPKILSEYRPLDFGAGFYTTLNKEQAESFCANVTLRNKRKNADYKGKEYINVYEFDLELARNEVELLEFQSADEDWLDFVYDNRNSKYMGEEYDIVIGPVANDTIYRVFALYEDGTIDREECIKQLKVRELFNQVVFKSERALKLLKFIEAREVLRDE